MRLILAITLCFSLLSCDNSDNNQEVQIYDNLIPEDEFAVILAETQIAEAHVSVLRIYQPYYKDSVQNYYKHIFDKHNITSEDFYYNLEEYTKDPTQLDQLYDKSLSHLESMKSELGDEPIPTPIINAITRQQLGDVIWQTPYLDFILEDTTYQTEVFRDSLFLYLNDNPDFVSNTGYSKQSIEYTYVLHSCTEQMYDQLKQYLENKLEKENNID